MNQAIIGLGSNIRPHENIREARDIVGKRFKILAESRLRRTKPIGPLGQPDFTNGTLLIETELNADQLKADLKAIETQLGRETSIDPFKPRTIDLDIVVWNGAVTDKDFYSRDYLKQSVLELVPELKY